MSLIEKLMVDCKIMNHIRTDDPAGGYAEVWTEGATFPATIIKNNTTEAHIAEKQGVKELFTVVTKKGFQLNYHDVFKRVEDGQIFRVTGNTEDSEAPEQSTIKIGKVQAEKWVLPS